MHEITAYVPEDDRCVYRTEKGARHHELRAMMKAATLSMPDFQRRTDDLSDFLVDMLISETYPTVADKLVEAVSYFQEYRAVLRGPGRGN